MPRAPRERELPLATWLLAADAPALVRVGSVATRSGPADVEVVDGRAYVIETEGPPSRLATEWALRLVDVTHPAAPIGVGRLELPGPLLPGVPVVPPPPLAIEVGGAVAYVSGYATVRIDVSDPADPVELEARVGRGRTSVLDLAGDLLLTGLGATDVSDPSAPRLLGALFPPGSGSAPLLEPLAKLAQGLVFAVATSGVRIVDLGPEYGLTLPVAIDLGQRGAAPRRSRGLLSVARGEDAGIAPGDTEACLSGETFEGVFFAGCAALEGPPRGEPPRGRGPSQCRSGRTRPGADR